MSRTSTSKGRSEVLLKAVEVYRPENAGGPDLAPVGRYLSTLFPTIHVGFKSSLLGSAGPRQRERLASEIASSRMRDPNKRRHDDDPFYGEIEYEMRILEGDAKAGGVVYDGRRLGQVLLRLTGEPDLETARVVVTDRLISTFSQDDMRHHLRTVILGFPSIVSIPGIIEAPARPRSFNIQKQTLEMMGASDLELERLKAKFKGSYIDYGDPEIVDVMKGLALQAVMFHLTLRPFCRSRTCRLFNAHWQEDLIASQVTSGGFCARHESQLRALGRTPRIAW